MDLFIIVRPKINVKDIQSKTLPPGVNIYY